MDWRTPLFYYPIHLCDYPHCTTFTRFHRYCAIHYYGFDFRMDVDTDCELDVTVVK